MRLIIKARRMPIGTISHGRKKVAEGKWIPISRIRVKGNKVEEQIKKAYDWIFEKTDNKFEAMMILDTNGKIVANKLGEESTIDLEEEGHLLKGNIFLHNHPNGASFSDSDILAALTTGMKEVRAVGKKYEYVFRPVEYLPMSRASLERISEIKRFFASESETLIDGYRIRFKAGEITADEANIEHWDELMKRFVAKFGGHYERRER